MAGFVTWLARLIAAATAVVLAIAAKLHVESGERWLAYVAMVPGWLVLYIAMDRWLGSRRRAGRLVLAVIGAGLALLSTAMAGRYLMSPELIQRLDQATTRINLIAPAGKKLSCYSTNRPDLPRVIFIHGTPGHAGVFAEYLLEPIPGFEVVAVDRLGFGRSSPGDPVVSFGVQAQAIALLLEQRQGQWPIVVGHSLGGPIAARVAADYPDRVRALVILAGSLDPELEAPSWYNEATMLPVIDLKMPTAYDVSNAEIAGAREQTRLLADVLDRIRCPVEVVHGTADTLVPVANTDYIRRSMVNSPRVHITIIDGEGHGVHKRRADVSEAILRVVQPLR